MPNNSVTRLLMFFCEKLPVAELNPIMLTRSAASGTDNTTQKDCGEKESLRKNNGAAISMQAAIDLRKNLFFCLSAMVIFLGIRVLQNRWLTQHRSTKVLRSIMAKCRIFHRV